MSNLAQQTYPADHPVACDSALRERLLDLMWLRIQKTISPGASLRRRSRSNADLQLAGGISAAAVLYAALDGLLQFDPARLKGTWEGLAVVIAHNKAVQAVRDNASARRRGEREVDLAPLDTDAPEDRRLAGTMTDPLANPEAEAIALGQERIYKRLADSLLSDRDREIYYRIHYRGETRAAICGDYQLTAQGVGYIYTKSARTIHEASREDPEFLRLSEHMKEGQDDD